MFKLLVLEVGFVGEFGVVWEIVELVIMVIGLGIVFGVLVWNLISK